MAAGPVGSARVRPHLDAAAIVDAALHQGWLGGSVALAGGQLPALAAVRDQLEALRDRDIYRVGVEVILDAVEARAASAP
jgi:hypothetical protein